MLYEINEVLYWLVLLIECRYIVIEYENSE